MANIRCTGNPRRSLPEGPTPNRSGIRAGEFGLILERRVEREEFFGYKKHSRAARRVCGYRQPLKDTQVEATVYLTSDGYLAMGMMGTPIALRGKELDSVLSGKGPLGDLPIGVVVEGLRAIADEG